MLTRNLKNAFKTFVAHRLKAFDYRRLCQFSFSEALKIIIILAPLSFFFLTVAVLAEDLRDVRKYEQLKADIEELEAENERLQTQVDELTEFYEKSAEQHREHMLLKGDFEVKVKLIIIINKNNGSVIIM